MNDDALAAARTKAQDGFRALKSRVPTLSDDAIDLILRDARSHYAWTDKPVSQETLKQIFDITLAGPTSMNTCPARFVFVTSSEGKERIAKSLKPGNVQKVVTPMTQSSGPSSRFSSRTRTAVSSSRAKPRIPRQRRSETARSKARIS